MTPFFACICAGFCVSRGFRLRTSIEFVEKGSCVTSDLLINEGVITINS